jgi:hypothetical protein
MPGLVGVAFYKPFQALTWSPNGLERTDIFAGRKELWSSICSLIGLILPLKCSWRGFYEKLAVYT